MNYRLLGKSGLRVSEISLGTMTFGEDWGWGSPKDEARKVYDTYREAGGNFIDTANLSQTGQANGSSANLSRATVKNWSWPRSSQTPLRVRIRTQAGISGRI